MSGPFSKIAAVAGSLALMASAPAAAAAQSATPNPSAWASLSAFASTTSAQALCGAAAGAAAAAQAGAAPGCVLPAVDAPVTAVETPAPIETVPAVTTGGGGIGILPLLLGLAALAGLAYLLLNNDDDDEIAVSPN